MSKKIFDWMLMAAVVCGLSIFVTSCKDDDDDEKSEEQKQQEAAKANDDATAFWNVVSQLTNGDAIGDDYLQQTFEPTIGQADETNPLVRIVATNDLATAVKRFNDLTGASINESTQTYEWKNDAVGTLTWTKGTGQDYGTVDVNIKQMPRLQKIVYRDGDQMGTNASFNGTAWYRFGDVVEKDGHYWICVRPAFGPEKKQDSHWVCVDKLDDKNIDKCSKGGKTWYVPKKLGENTEQMGNFAELLFAMFNPVDWYSNIKSNSKMKLFHDFSQTNLKYHSIAYWRKVYQRWHENNIFKTVMGVSEDEVRKAVLEDKELTFMCWGYSWWSSLSWNLTLKQYTYSGDNMKTETPLKKEVNMQNMDEFNLTGEYWKEWKALSKFFGDSKEKPRWIIRHAKGKDLCTGSYHEQRQLSGCKDFSTYYTGQSENSLKNNSPEVTIGRGKGEVGEVLAQNGDFYSTAIDAQMDNTSAIGIVVFRDNEQSVAPTWKNGACGLVMSIEDVGGNKYWVSNDNNNTCPVATTIDELSDIFNNLYNSSDLQGYSVFQKMSQQHTCRHPAVEAVADWGAKWKGTREVSTWFIPTLGEWALVLNHLAKNIETILPNNPKYKGLSYADVFTGQPDYSFKAPVNDLFTDLYHEACITLTDDMLGFLKKAPEDIYWTATQVKGTNDEWVVQFGEGVGLYTYEKNKSAKVRAFCAFTAR